MTGVRMNVCVWPPTMTSISGTARARAMSSPSVIGPLFGSRTPPWLMQMITSAPSARSCFTMARAVSIGSGKVSAPGLIVNVMESAPIMPNRPNVMPPRSITLWLRIAPAAPSAFMPSSAGSAASKFVLAARIAGTRPALAGRGHGAGESRGSEIEVMIAERRRVVARHRQALQFGAGLLARSSERGADGGVADVEHEHGSVRLASSTTIGDQRGDALDAADRAVVVERGRRVVRGRADADEIGVNVVGVEDCEGHGQSVGGSGTVKRTGSPAMGLPVLNNGTRLDLVDRERRRRQLLEVEVLRLLDA